MKKRIVSFILILAVCFGMLSATAFGAAIDASEGNKIVVDMDHMVFKNGAANDISNLATYYYFTENPEDGEDMEGAAWQMTSDGTTFANDEEYDFALNAYKIAQENITKNEYCGPLHINIDGTQYEIVFQAACTHDMQKGYDDNKHWETCSICGFGTEENHNATSYKNLTPTHHTGVCECGYEFPAGEHTFGDDGICTVCEYAQTVTLKFVIDGEEVTVDSTCGQPVRLPEKAPTQIPEGKKFTGRWQDETGKELTGNARPDMANHTYTPLWEDADAPETYTVTVKVDGNGTVTGTPEGKIAEGTEVTLVAHPNDGNEFVNMTSDDVTVSVDKEKKTGTFNMPAKNVTVNVTFKATSTDPSTPSGSGGGSSKPSIKPGTTTTPTDPVPNPGDQTGTGTVAGFSDVSASAWYADAVKYVVDRGLFGGVGNGRFAPDANMTRAMMWTVLARYKGVDTNTGSNWYEAARTWAMQQNISDGTMADGNVTREQFVTMLWRLSGEPAATNSASFTDNGRVSSYAQNAVNWAVAQGIVNGYNDGSFRPQGSATRAEVAKMLMVFCVTSEG